MAKKQTPSVLIKESAVEGINGAIRDLPKEVKSLVLAKVLKAMDFEGERWNDDDSPPDSMASLLKKRAEALAKKILKDCEVKVPKKKAKELREAYKEKFMEALATQVEEMATKHATELAERLVKKELAGIDAAKIDFNKELDIHDPACDSCMRVAVLENALMAEFGPKAIGQMRMVWTDRKGSKKRRKKA